MGGDEGLGGRIGAPTVGGDSGLDGGAGVLIIGGDGDLGRGMSRGNIGDIMSPRELFKFPL